MKPRDSGSGFTLIEVLVVIFIIGVLIGLLLPAVQSARDSSRRITCQNNIRQISVALQSYEGRRRRLPSLYNGSFLPQPRDSFDEFHFHSWRSAILGELEQSTVFDSINWSVPASDLRNQTAINFEIAVFICPSTSNTHPIVPEVFGFSNAAVSSGTAARSDYEAIGGVQVEADGSTPSSPVDFRGVRFGAWGQPKYNAATGQSISYGKARFAAITDGLSHTLLIGERGGRPDIFDSGHGENPYPYLGDLAPPDSQQAAWGISTNFWWLVFGHEQMVNQTNRKGIYGFHPGGASVAFADGSVRFLADSTSPSVLTAMATRAEGDSIDEASDYQ